MFTPSLLDAPRRLVEVQVLSPVAVLPRSQRQGFGTSLINLGLKMVADRHVPVVFLQRSPGYCSRFGFAPGAERGFRTALTTDPRPSVPGLPSPAVGTLDEGDLRL